MSPEQASGRDVDHRSDIFSLGVVLYELLAGKLPFRGDHEAAIIYGIMHNNPEPLQASRSDIPDGFQYVMDMALAKNVDERYQSAQGFEDALAELGWHTGVRERVPSRGVARVLRSPVRRIVPWILLGGTALAIGLLVIRNTVRSPTSDPSPSVSATYTQLTFTGAATDPVISPDGQFVAYVRDTGNEREVLVKDIGGGEPIVLLDGFASLVSLRWSPDSSRLLIVAWSSYENDERHTYIIPRLGGSVRRLGYYGYAVWSPDGRRLAVCRSRWKKISFIDVSTGQMEADSLKLEFPYVWLHEPDWSPDGERLLVHVEAEDGGEEIWTIGVDGRGAKRVVKGRVLGSPRWSPSGESIYYVIPTGVMQAIWRAGIDSRSGDALGEPELVLSGIAGLGRRGKPHMVRSPTLEVTSDGKSLAYARRVVDKDIWLVSSDQEDGNAEPVSTQLTTGTAIDDWPSVSPDGQQITFVRVMGEASNVFLMPIEGGSARQVTFMNSECYFPVWSPDGREIAFVSYESGEYQVWKVSARGGAAEVFENTRVGQSRRLGWAPGKRIIYPKVGNRNLMVLDPGSGDASPLLNTDEVIGNIAMDAVISPDGGRVAVHWGDRRPTDKEGIWIRSLLDAAQSFVLQGHKHPFGWSQDDEWIYYYDIPSIGRVRPDGSGDEVVVSLPFEDGNAHPVWSMSADGKHLVGAVEVKTPSDIWLIEDFDSDIQR
jgi:Tol biopolymer transport system component